MIYIINNRLLNFKMSKAPNSNNLRNNVRNTTNTVIPISNNIGVNIPTTTINNEISLSNKVNNNITNFSTSDIDLNRDSKISQKLECTGKLPSARFGHTITMVSNTKVVMFGGAIGDTKNFSFSNETYVLNISTKAWTKVESK